MRVTDFHQLASDGSQLFVADRNIVSSDGRWMIIKVSVGSVVFDLARGEFVPGVELPGTPLCFEPSGHLLMYNPSGLMRWIFKWDESSSRLNISWDDQVFAYRNNHHWARSPNGMVLAIPRDSEGTVLGHIEGKRFKIDRQFGPQREVRSCVMSPDDRFLVTGSHGVLESDEPTLKVWDLSTGECILQQRRYSIAWPQFSSDGRWLFVNDPIMRVLRVGTWEEVVVRDIHFKHVCFAPNGKFIVNSSENGYVQLLMSDDLSLVANLAVPFSEAVIPLYVSDEGDRLVVRTLTGERFASFAMRSIHDQLVELNPKWSFLAEQESKSQKNLVAADVVFEAGELGRDWRTRRQRAIGLVRQADDLWDDGDFGRALQCLSEAVELDPLNCEIANELAWFCLVGPDALKSPDRAIQLGLKITEREPTEQSYANTLAFAYLQNGQYNEAIAVLDRSEKESGYLFDAFDGYCKASCLLRLGKTDEAHSLFKMAQAWQLEHASTLDSRRKDAVREFLQTWETALSAAKEQ